MQPRYVQVPLRLGVESVKELAQQIEEINADRSASVLVLEGGTEAFCLGLDTDQLLETPDPSVRRQAVEGYQRVLRGIRLGPKPTMALVDAPARGGGVGLVAACDLVVATERASFAFPEALFGLIPAMVMPLALERMMPQKLRLWATLASSRSVEEAQAAGLVDEVVASEQLDRTARRWARQLGRCRPAGIAELAAFSARARRLSLEEALRQGGEITLAASGDVGVRRALHGFKEHGMLCWDEEEEA